MAVPDGTRIGDAERQQVIDVLRRATGEGRLTLDEFAERAGEVFAARTRGELDRVVDDLPPGIRPPAAGTRAATGTSTGAATPTPTYRPASPGDSAPARGRRRFVAIMGGSRPRGRWRAAGKITAFAFWGTVAVDLRNALIETPTLDITAWALMGGVRVVVPEGIPVELDGFVLMGGARDATRPGRAIEGAPVVRVRARGLWGGVRAITRSERPRRSRHDRQRDDQRRRDRDRDGDDQRRRDRDRDDAATGPEADTVVGTSPGADADLPGRPSPTSRVPVSPPAPLPGPSVGDRIPPMPGDLAAGADGAEAVPTPAGPAAASDPASSGTTGAPGAAPADAVGGNAGTNAGPNVGANGADRLAPEGAPSPAPGPGGGTLTVLVTDICGSTETAARLGDQRWLGVLQAHNALVREQIQRHRGTEVKAQGDGFLVTFTSARQAVLAGAAIQKALASYRQAHPEHPIEVRIGIHTGEVVEDRGDVLGQNVTLAVRIADAARAGEVLVSSLTKDLTEAGGDLSFDDGRTVELKGVPRPWRVHAYAWS
ncbi:MAG TPA: DUF1707 domain-containing protein [Acidimicrobiales bacterium]